MAREDVVHELAIAESVVEAVLARTERRPVRVVRLRIGRLSGVVLDAFTFAFTLAADDTPLAGADLLIDEPEGRLTCRSCGRNAPTDDLILLCRCGSADVEITAGKELALVAVEVA
jgi:hydrogenase nickel incorporation protein HypA/HybF